MYEQARNFELSMHVHRVRNFERNHSKECSRRPALFITPNNQTSNISRRLLGIKESACCNRKTTGKSHRQVIGTHEASHWNAGCENASRINPFQILADKSTEFARIIGHLPLFSLGDRGIIRCAALSQSGNHRQENHGRNIRK